MADVFSLFDHPFRIELLHPVKGTRDQSTGEWGPATATTTAIAGSFDRPTAQGAHGLIYEQHGEQGTTEVGEMRLFTTATIALEDRVRVYFDQAATLALAKTYRVKGIVKDYSWLESFLLPDGRLEYALVPEEPAR